jgi:DNA modification methylase
MTITIFEGDCRDVLRTLEDESVHCVVTSPPYFGLRDYGVAGQVGLEESPDAFVAELVGVFREVRRVLRDDGTAWINLGDSYANNGKWGGHTGGKHVKALHCSPIGRNKRCTGLKPKDLIGIPWRVALALQADGWVLRRDIIWHKLNPMPESVQDRPSTAHEYLFLLAKSSGNALCWRHGETRQWALSEPAPEWRWRHRSSRAVSSEPQDGDGWYRFNVWDAFDYYYDADAILEPVSPNTHARLSQDVAAQVGSARANGGAKTNGNMKAVGRKRGLRDENVKANDDFHNATCLPVIARNKRSVWSTTTEAFTEAHFAVFPPSLIEPCIQAGCPGGGTVLDPFLGAGTTALVADRLGRNCIGIELNPDYAAMAKRRLEADAGMFAQTEIVRPLAEAAE